MQHLVEAASAVAASLGHLGSEAAAVDEAVLNKHSDDFVASLKVTTRAPGPFERPC